MKNYADKKNIIDMPTSSQVNRIRKMYGVYELNNKLWRFIFGREWR